MGFFDKYFVEIRKGTKVTLSESDLNKLERTYEQDLFDKKKKQIFSPFRKEQQRSFQTQLRDYAFEQILDRHLYTFKHILVIPNPYGIASQTALLLFNSSVERKVRYRVRGDRESDDFWGETILEKRHRIPVLGLYQKRNNDVDLWLLDADDRVVKHRLLKIFVPEVNLDLEENIGGCDREVSQFPLILLSGVNHRPIAVDSSGKLRYRLKLGETKVGILPLENGNFLVVDSTANRLDSFGDIMPCRYHEMDYMGRVYRSFLLEYRIGGAITSHGDSLFLVTDSDSSHLNDRLAELDMNSGEIVSYCDMRKILGDKYCSEGDWTAIRSIRYSDGMLYVTLKRLHTILLLDWETKQIQWLLAPDTIWKDTPLSALCLVVDGCKESVCLRPDSAVPVLTDGKNASEVAIFSTGVQGDIKTGDKSLANSTVRLVRIDKEAMTCEVIAQKDVDRCIAHGDVIALEGEGQFLATLGKLGKRSARRRACLARIDFANHKSDCELSLPKKFSDAWVFRPDLTDYCRAIPVNKNVMFGSLSAPEVFEGELGEISEEKLDRYYFGRVMLCDDLLLVTMVPGAVDRLIFKGETHAYVQDYSGIQESDQRVRFAVSLRDFAMDDYYIYVQMQDGLYLLKNEIRIEK